VFTGAFKEKLDFKATILTISNQECWK